MRISDETIARWYNGIQTNEPEAIAEFYANLQRTYGHDRYLLVTEPYGDTIDDILHDAFIEIVTAVRSGRIREPGALLGFSKIVIRFTGIQNIHRVRKLRATRYSLPVYLPVTQQLIDKQLIEDQTHDQLRADLDVKLSRFAALDREILERFYLKGQNREQICRELDLTEAQFRNRKHHAKNLLQTGSREKSRANARYRTQAAA